MQHKNQLRLVCISALAIVSSGNSSAGPFSWCDDCSSGGGDPISGFLVLLVSWAALGFGWVIWGRQSMHRIYIPAAIGLAIVFAYMEFFDSWPQYWTIGKIAVMPLLSLALGWTFMGVISLLRGAPAKDSSAESLLHKDMKAAPQTSSGPTEVPLKQDPDGGNLQSRTIQAIASIDRNKLYRPSEEPDCGEQRKQPEAPKTRRRVASFAEAKAKSLEHFKRKKD